VSLDGIRIVLVEPRHPGNIGAVARAMKAMDLSRLVLVRPVRYPDPEADARAAGSGDVLSRAVVVDSIDTAVGDCKLVIGGTARSRSYPLPVVDAREAGRIAFRESAAGEGVAVVFGPERTGLCNEDLDRCGLALRIPTSSAFSSLNLASAVQLFAYEAFMASREGQPPAGRSAEYPSQSEMDYFFGHLESALDAHDFIATNKRLVTLTKLRRIFGRARPSAGELKLLHSLVKLMERDDRS
jgi:tRNA (cytidine32/uridine32-2'-O)-methyltransferase